MDKKNKKRKIVKIEKDEQKGMTRIMCSHLQKGMEHLSSGGTNRNLPEMAAIGYHWIELEPRLIFECCSWCQSFVLKNALLTLVQKGTQVTFSKNDSRD